MEKYLILDSNNNWLSFATDETLALEELQELSEEDNFAGMQVGDRLFLYKAELIKSINKNEE